VSGLLFPARWSAPPVIAAGHTERIGGVSEGPWAALNLGANSGDEPDKVRANRDRLAGELPAAPKWLRQVHGIAVARHDGKPDIEATADAVVAFEPGRVCAVLTADCLPVVFCSRSGDRVAVAHAGWRGLAGGVLQATVEALEEDPGRLMAWLGPAIGPNAYEVGEDVVAAFPQEYPTGFRAHGDRWMMDLYALARAKLAAAGVTDVSGGDCCTWSEPDRFYSYRREGTTGRMATLAWIRDA
jgi:YfiH family protein